MLFQNTAPLRGAWLGNILLIPGAVAPGYKRISATRFFNLSTFYVNLRFLLTNKTLQFGNNVVILQVKIYFNPSIRLGKPGIKNTRIVVINILQK
ncbi:hypothetical protein AGMMS50239_07190 [Bacteroidia bacterium]|nr:hypothetical protein AGMMS50239_07190 [Bacteroidia bacterium]